MPKRMRVVTSSNGNTPAISQQNVPATTPRVVVTSENPRISNRLTENEMRVRINRRYATSTTFGGLRSASTDVLDSGTAQFYSPQLSTDFLEKPQNLRERRAFYRFFYNTNEIVGRAVDIHSTLPLSKLRLVSPKGKNPHQNEYVMKFFENMCEEMKLFKTLIEITHDYNLFGNCVAKWAEINTLNGIKRIEYIKVGDSVLTNKGRYRKVTKTTCRQAEEIIKIKCWKDFREIPVTKEHPIEILKNEKFEFVQAGEIKIGDYIRVTWPQTVEDTDYKILNFPSYYDIGDGTTSLNFIVKHPRDPLAIVVRKKLLGWLGSLKEPLIIDRRSLSRLLGIDLTVLDSTVHKLDQELDQVYHKRIGAKGYQQGSQVMWFPIDTSDIEVTEEYTIYKKKQLKSIHKIKIDEDFCYLLGYWLGDGTLGRDSSRDTWGRGLWQINFKETAEKNISRVRDILIKIFGSDSISEWVSDGMKYVKVISNPAFNEWWADNFGETSRIRNEKRIPAWIINLPENKLKHLLSGVLDSDGCVTHNNGVIATNTVSVSMISRNLMTQIRDVVFKCGGVINYNISKTHVNGSLSRMKDLTERDFFDLNSSDEKTCKIFTEFSNKKLHNNSIFSADETHAFKRGPENTIAFKVKSITYQDYNDLVHNFEVEEDHTYQVEGFSTHNCFIYCENNDLEDDDRTPEERARKKEEATQRSQYLKEKFKISDKDPLYKGWKKLIVLPPDQVRIRKLPLTDDVAIEYVPDPQTKEFIVQGGYVSQDPHGGQKKISMPADLQDKVRQSGIIPLDTDPNSGSYVYHLARKKSQYEPLGVSIIERCINTLILLDKLRQAQTSIASRHMTPMRIVWAEDLSVDDVDSLREQVDMALVDPDYSIIANYEVHWEEMGSQGRLLDIEAENEAGLNRLLAGLGMTREILTGEGSYTGSRISLEIMNTEYLLFREILQDYVENYLFKPVAKKKGFIEYDEYGNETLLYPKLSFTRLAIRDNEQFFDAAYQLYQKGSISIDLILDILNIDPISTKQKIENDLFTVNDSLFNELLRNIYTNVSAPIVEQTDVVSKLAKYLHLNQIETEEAPAGAKRFSNNQSISDEDKEKALKLAKIMKHFKDHPDLLEKVFDNVSKRG